MNKFYGKIGYADTVETRPGIWEERIKEQYYYGDVMPNVRRLEQGESINDNVVLNNKISIIADPYANEHFFSIRYVDWMGCFWKVTNVEVQTPRLILTIGDVYNGYSNRSP